MENIHSKSVKTKHFVFIISSCCFVLSWVAVLVAGLSHQWNVLHLLLGLAFLSGVVASFTITFRRDY